MLCSHVESDSTLDLTPNDGSAGVGESGARCGARCVSIISARDGRRQPGACGVRSVAPRSSNDAALLYCATKVAEKFSAMTDAYIGRSSVSVQDVARKEVKKAMSESMQELKSLIQS